MIENREEVPFPCNLRVKGGGGFDLAVENRGRRFYLDRSSKRGYLGGGHYWGVIFVSYLCLFASLLQVLCWIYRRLFFPFFCLWRRRDFLLGRTVVVGRDSPRLAVANQGIYFKQLRPSFHHHLLVFVRMFRGLSKYPTCKRQKNISRFVRICHCHW